MIPAAYQSENQRRETMENPFNLSQLFQGHDVTPVQALSKIVLAGARSAGLATQAIMHAAMTREHSPGSADALTALAKAVLGDWGISWPKDDPAAAAPPAPVPASSTLTWPPKPPALPTVYTENYFHVRNHVTGRDDVLGVVGDEALDLDPDMKLRFTGTARWEEGRGWWLRMALASPTGAQLTTWILHTGLRPGDEIPEEAS